MAAAAPAPAAGAPAALAPGAPAPEARPPAGPPAGGAAAPAPGAAPQTPEQRLAAAEAKRAEGNDRFRAGEAAAAQKAYDEALRLLLRQAFEDVEDKALLDRVQACRVPAQLNLALCCLRAEPCEAARALELCEEVLEAEPKNAKATYRKGKALLELGEVAEAEYELAQACKLAPADAAVRRDLDALRRRIRGEKEREKKTYGGLFGRGPGFASDDRGAERRQDSAASSSDDRYDFICDPARNPYADAERPDEQAAALVAQGRLEDGVFALEAALRQTASRGSWDQHFGNWLELGRLFMDMNVDALALRCLNRAAGVGPGARGRAGEAQCAPEAVQRSALLLRAVCLLNEAEGDTLAAVSECLGAWLDVARPAAGAADAADAGADVDARLAAWRAAEPDAAGADAAVAQGLLCLLRGHEATPQAFAEAVADAGGAVDAAAAGAAAGASCFGGPRRRPQRWNMLGAVLANRKRHADALVAYEQALAAQPHYPRALTNRGIALQAGGNAAGAAAAFLAAVELVPEWAALTLWKMLETATEDQPSWAEAVGQKSIPRLRELLGGAAAEPAAAAGPAGEAAGEVLRRLGLP